MTRPKGYSVLLVARAARVDETPTPAEYLLAPEAGAFPVPVAYRCNRCDAWQVKIPPAFGACCRCHERLSRPFAPVDVALVLAFRGEVLGASVFRLAARPRSPSTSPDPRYLATAIATLAEPGRSAAAVEAALAIIGANPLAGRVVVTKGGDEIRDWSP